MTSCHSLRVSSGSGVRRRIPALFHSFSTWPMSACTSPGPPEGLDHAATGDQGRGPTGSGTHDGARFDPAPFGEHLVDGALEIRGLQSLQELLEVVHVLMV